MSSGHTDLLTCCCCLMPLDQDQVGEVDDDGDIICLDCLADAEGTKSNPKRAGRPPGSKNVKAAGVRITPTVRAETKAWLNHNALSIGKAIDMLVAQEIKRQRGE